MTPRLRLSHPLARAAVLAVGALAGPALLPAVARAQGLISMQGYGYPVGQLSTRAQGTGGALGEFDTGSPLNPASAVGFFRPSVSVQFDPEQRRLAAGGRTSSGVVPRFPVVMVGIPGWKGTRFALSASTLLDRSFSATRETSGSFEGVVVPGTENTSSRGAITDVRGAVAVPIRRWLRVGVAGHLLVGDNRVSTTLRFQDSTRLAPLSDSVVVDWRGSAYSAGVELVPVRGVAVATSYRLGRGLRADRNDTTVARADAPDRLGLALRVDRITGASFAVSWARTYWSNMAPLGGATLRAEDGDELRAGVETQGPRFNDIPILLRVGYAQRDLPFGVAAGMPRERSYGGGLGVPVAGGRALVDFALNRASRTLGGTPFVGAAPVSARENAWLFSVGLTVRP